MTPHLTSPPLRRKNHHKVIQRSVHKKLERPTRVHLETVRLQLLFVESKFGDGRSRRCNFLYSVTAHSGSVSIGDLLSK